MRHGPAVAPASSPSVPCRGEASAALRRISVLWVLFFALFLAACGKRERLVDHGNREQILHRALEADPAELDPHIVTGIFEQKIVTALFEPLLEVDGATGKTIPALASGWDVSADGLTYTFHVRPGARWSNGEPLVAADIIASWKRAMTPSLAADYGYLFHVIRGADAFVQAGGRDAALPGLESPDDHTLIVRLARPVSFFPELLGVMAFRPVHVRSIASLGDPYKRGIPWTRPERMVTSGPFRLKEWSPNRRVVVEKSSHYWDASRVRLREIHFHPGDGEETEEREFRAGQLHATSRLPLTKILPYRRDNPELLRMDPALDTFFFRFNVRRPPLDDARVRRALSLVIDREALTKNVLLGGQQPAPTLVPPATPHYTPPARHAYDPVAARRLLGEAGFPEGKGFPPVELLIPGASRARSVSEAVQEMWRRELGLDVRLIVQEAKVIFAARRAGDYQILLSTWVGDYPDATTFLDLLRSDSNNNHTGWASRDYDALLDDAARTKDPIARAAILQKAETLMLDAAPIAPIFFNTHVYLLHPAVKGWHPTAFDQLNYKHVWLESER